MTDLSQPVRARVFKYANPSAESAKTIVKLARTDRMMSNVHVLKEGGENNLHSHKHLDGFWFVLKGRVSFYGEGDKLIAELGPHEGILVPRHFAYWFESTGEEDLELLQVESYDVSLKTDEDVLKDRKNAAPLKPSYARINIVDAEGHYSD